MNKRTRVFCVLRRPCLFFNTRARTCGPGTEILEVWDSKILGGSDRPPKIILDLRAGSERFRNFGSRPRTNRPRAYQKNGRHKTRPIKLVCSNGCEGSLCSGNMKQRTSFTSNSKQTGRRPADMLDIYKYISSDLWEAYNRTGKFQRTFLSLQLRSAKIVG